MILLHVWIRLPDGRHRMVGDLVTTEPNANGRFESEFEYASAWAADTHAFDLDPASLSRLRGPRFQSINLQPPLGVFEDALPDSWGQRLLAMEIKAAGGKPTPPAILRRLGANGLGALSFSERDDPPLETATAQRGELGKLLDAAEAFEAGRLPVGQRFRRLVEAGGVAGGARPKALLRDPDVEWIGKFPSRERDEHHDVVGLEATCMRLASGAGLDVAETRLQAVGKRRILLVRRFDVTPQGGRHHMISFRSLCKERPGIFDTSYDELSEALRKYTADPLRDVAALFTHAAFNAAIGNVDDHLKNFWMIHREEGWRLAPAFDLTPDTGFKGEHTLAFGLALACPTRDVLLRIGERWGVDDAADRVSRVAAAAREFASVAKELRVKGAPSIRQIAADIERRGRLLAGERQRGNPRS